MVQIALSAGQQMFLARANPDVKPSEGTTFEQDPFPAVEHHSLVHESKDPRSKLRGI
jgi:hypothetical protein